MATNSTPRKSRKPAANLVLNMTTSVEIDAGTDNSAEIAALAELDQLIDSTVLVADDDAGSDDAEMLADADDSDVVEVEVAAAEPEAEVLTEPPVVVAAPTPDAETSALDALIASLGAPEAAEAAPVVTDAALLEAVEQVEAVEIATAAAETDTAPEGSVPTGEGTDVADPEVEAAPVKTKKASTPRVSYGTTADGKVRRLKDKLGDSAAEYTVLTLDDAGLDEQALAAKVDETFGLIAKMNKKEANRAAMFIEFVAGKKSQMNNVLKRVLQVLAADGYLTTGMQGNVMVDLLSVPYSAGAARAMGGNTIGMYEDLAVLKADGKGRFIANPDSLLLMKANQLLGLEYKAPPVVAPVEETPAAPAV